MKDIIEKLISNKETLSTMESCTGGGVSNAITNIEGASEVFNFSAITYSNEYKIKMGVDKDIIDKYTVYSMQVADSMAKSISNYTNSTYGIGVTGKMCRIDKYNLSGADNKVYISIYNTKDNRFYNTYIIVNKDNRVDNKELVINKIVEMLDKIC